MLAPPHDAADAVRARATIDADGTVEGYASLFGVIDAARDMIMPGAFARTLGLRGVRRIPMLFQHDPAEPIGIWDELAEDWRGLRVRGRLIPDVQRSREVLSLIRAGALDGLSIGFRTTRARVDPVTRVRKLSDVELWEISVVTFPLLAGARVSAMKHVARVSAAKPGSGRAGGEPVPDVADAHPGYGRHRHPILTAPARIFPPGRVVRVAPRAKYSPDQPRVPAGNRDGGQWVNSSGGGGGRPGAARTRLADAGTRTAPGTVLSDGAERPAFPSRVRSVGDESQSEEAIKPTLAQMVGEGGPIYDKADSALLAPKGVRAASSEQTLKYSIDENRYLGGATVVNEDRTATGRFLQSVRRTEVHVKFDARIQTADGAFASSFEIRKELSAGSSVTIPWKDLGVMRGPGQIEVTASNVGALHTGVIVGARRVP